MTTHTKTCYGVGRNDHNELVANQFAANVQKIYALYLSGRSLRDICKSLQEARIYSPSGKSEWTPRAIEIFFLMPPTSTLLSRRTPSIRYARNESAAPMPLQLNMARSERPPGTIPRMY